MRLHDNRLAAFWEWPSPQAAKQFMLLRCQSDALAARLNKMPEDSTLQAKSQGIVDVFYKGLHSLTGTRASIRTDITDLLACTTGPPPISHLHY